MSFKNSDGISTNLVVSKSLIHKTRKNSDSNMRHLCMLVVRTDISADLAAKNSALCAQKSFSKEKYVKELECQTDQI